MTRFRAGSLALGLLLALVLAPPFLAADFPIEGSWGLDLKASRNVPESKKGVDLLIERKGNQVTTTRLVGGKPVGDPLVVATDGKERPIETGGTKATVAAFYSRDGRALEQELKVGVEEQHAVITLSADGKTMTRVESMSKAGVKTSERTLVYQRR
jgi:hypothetical protein